MSTKEDELYPEIYQDPRKDLKQGNDMTWIVFYKVESSNYEGWDEVEEGVRVEKITKGHILNDSVLGSAQHRELHRDKK